MPARARSFMALSTSLIISGSSALVGSSNSMTLGCMARARAMATRCCWPPESSTGYLRAWSWMPTRSSSSMAMDSALAFCILRTLVGARVTLCSTERCGYRLNCWKTMPTSVRSSFTSTLLSWMLLPSSRICPFWMGSSRFRHRMKELLPEPEGPQMTSTSPFSTFWVMPLSTWNSPYHLCTSWNSIIAMRGRPYPVPAMARAAAVFLPDCRRCAPRRGAMHRQGAAPDGTAGTRARRNPARADGHRPPPLAAAPRKPYCRHGKATASAAGSATRFYRRVAVL